ncbi:hypothetical protein GCM10007160_32050 [Litchfieldella qijiaojingensis]|uniref:Membrane transport protein MMPL domain-containing protein n=1 Tax=Litchfieldella qijiaojingensis TaxID=980347 RepID=A0ABQ2Z581_9GAMM|nr:MMPL family transporter [Halomonas qijiaojingensis]GGY01681.1 hypothetical protein GCM10007160_32050 [Halomonas qijiaojingensis]
MTPRLAAAFAYWVRLVVSRAGWFTLGTLLLAGLSLFHAANYLGIDTDTTNMLDPELPFQRAYDRYQQEFPQYEDTLVLVVQSETPETASEAAKRLVQRLGAEKDLIKAVYLPRGGDFFERNGLLFLKTEELTLLVDRLAQAQPLLARLADETSLARLFEVLAQAVGNAREGGLELERVLAEVDRAVVERLEGRNALVSWQQLMRGEDVSKVAREIVIVQPRLDYSRVMAGRQAMEAVRETIRELGFDDSEGATTVRVTGKVALQFEELISTLEGARLAGLLALVFVMAVLYLGLGSLKLMSIALVTLFVGLSLSVGIATLIVGHLNLISIAFAVLYVGLGVNFAIHFLLRYRECLEAGEPPRVALVTTGHHMGVALTLCTVTTAIGFFAFVPTAFVGIAELGLIAGTSMFITLAVSFTLLPALLELTWPTTATKPGMALSMPGWTSRLLALPQHHWRAVCWGAGIAGLAAVALLPRLQFDADPLNLRDPTSESVTTLIELLAAEPFTRRNLVVLAQRPEEVAALSERLEALEAVDGTINLFDFVPPEQGEKLMLIEEMELLLGPVLLTASFTPRQRSADDVITALAELRQALRDSEPESGSSEVTDRLGEHLAVLQERLERDTAARDRLFDGLRHQLLSTLPLSMQRLQMALQAQQVTLDTLPDDLLSRWRSPDGTYLVQVMPAEDLGQLEAQRHFIQAVRNLVPEVTGTPILQLESGDAVVKAFQQALLYAFGGISLVLLVILRNILLTLKVLVPLLLGSALTGAVMALTGIPFNFANVIALPLLLGVGVDNGIHMVYREYYVNETVSNVLQTSTARAILFGALTTTVSFGNLALSPHRGTASMGVVLAMGMILILLCTLVVLPALLRSR